MFTKKKSPFYEDHPEISPHPTILWPESDQTKLSHLWELYGVLVQIREWMPKNKEAYVRWLAHVKEWNERFQQSAKHFDAGLYYWIMYPSEILIRPSVEGYNAEHLEILDKIKIRCVRLESKLSAHLTLYSLGA